MPASFVVASWIASVPGGPPMPTGARAFEPVPHSIGPASTFAPATGLPLASTTRPEIVRPGRTVIVPVSAVLPGATATLGSVRSAKPGPRIVSWYVRGGTSRIENEPSRVDTGTLLPQPPSETTNIAGVLPS